jgi:hypothetical protein
MSTPFCWCEAKAALSRLPRRRRRVPPPRPPLQRRPPLALPLRPPLLHPPPLRLRLALRQRRLLPPTRTSRLIPSTFYHSLA